MPEIRKIKRAAFVLFVIVCMVLVWVIIDSAIGIFSITSEWNIASIALTCAGAVIVLAILAIALVTLFSTRVDETPFNSRNVRRLKVMAVLLVIFEPFIYLSSSIMRKLYPVTIGDVTIEAHSTIGGIALTAGLVVYCVSLVFEYGISLQRQVDETL